MLSVKIVKNKELNPSLCTIHLVLGAIKWGNKTASNDLPCLSHILIFSQRQGARIDLIVSFHAWTIGRHSEDPNMCREINRKPILCHMSPFTVSLENNFACYTHSIGINRISLKHAHCKSHTTNSTKIRWWKRTVIAANDKKMYNVPLCAEWWMFSAYFGIHPLCILNILWIGWMCLRYHSSRLDPLSHQVNWSRHQISRDPVQGGGHKIVTLPCCGKTAQLLRLEIEENSCAKQEGIFYFESTFLSPCQTLGQSWKKMLKTHRLKKREHEHK